MDKWYRGSSCDRTEGNIMEENKELYIQCSCGAEILKLEYDEEIDSYYFAVFSMDGRRSWRNRLRQIWNIIRHNEPYSDNLVLKSDELSKLVEFIDQINKDKNG